MHHVGFIILIYYDARSAKQKGEYVSKLQTSQLITTAGPTETYKILYEH
jgi:hypothetical protein